MPWAASLSTTGPPGCAARQAADHQAVGAFFDGDAGAAQLARHGDDAVGFLHAQFGEVAEHGVAFSQRRGDGQRWDLVDGAQRQLAADLGASQA